MKLKYLYAITPPLRKRRTTKKKIKDRPELDPTLKKKLRLRPVVQSHDVLWTSTTGTDVYRQDIAKYMGVAHTTPMY